MKKIFSCMLIVALLLSTCALAAAYTAGQYTVTVPGHNGDITLTVTTSEDAITGVKVVSHSETQNLGDTAMDAVIAQIIEKNSVEVDVVANATVSSQAVIDAVKVALERAEKGEVDAAVEETEVADDVLTFHDQCVAAGIAHTYVDPNADVYDFVTTDPTVDVLTHASGKAKYVDETDGPCIKTEADLVARSANKMSVYYWLADENGVATLEEAAALENAQYVSRPFPNDGQKYIIELRKNSIGTNLIVTVDETGFPFAAVYGLSWKLESNGTDCYASCSVMAETATMKNILNGSPILITYYEYNPYSELKIGVGNRNAGARLYCELDEERATLTFNDKDAEGNAIKMTVAEWRALDQETRDSMSIRYLSLRAVVIELTSIG